ncbi:MAG: PLP-dependent cysteine synthase family protein [Halobacteriales archaeon]|nr:PLP-dependent cysteine synthase family protein [Halobacteriales archaeon]
MDESVLDAIGSPLVAVPGPAGATVAAKLEWKNPGGSAKDRPALYMVRAAEEAGQIEPGDRLVEPTSGNTGVGLALVASALGYDLTVVMPSSKSAERRQLIEAYGATVELVDGDIADARERADAIEAEAGAVQLRQFENEANPRAHYETTGAEILEQVGGREVDAFVAAVGTGGTLMGAGRRLREAHPDVEIVAVEPAGNAALSGGPIGDDRFEGMGPGFVSDIVDTDLIDRVEPVSFEAAVEEARRLATDAGLLVGQSAGAASLAACRTASRLLGRSADDCPDVATTDGGRRLEAVGDNDGPLVVTVFPDSGERYLSTGMFDR